MAVNSDFVYGGAVSVIKVGGSGGVDLGATRGGVKITRSLTVHKSEVDQRTGYLDIRATMNEMHITTQLAEGSLENLAYAWNIPQSAIVSSSLQVLGSGDEEQEVYFEAPGPEGKTTYCDAYRCYAHGNQEWSWSRDADVEIPVDFEVMIDTSKTPNRFLDLWHA